MNRLSPNSQKLVLCLAGLAVLIGAGTLLLHKHSTANTTTLKPAEKDTAVQVVPPQEYTEKIVQPSTTFNITVKDEKLVNGPSTIKVKQGDAVRVNITAVGEEAKVHLHGYEIITESNGADDAPGGFSFVADTKGSFPFYAVEEQEDPADMSEPEETLLGTIVVE